MKSVKLLLDLAREKLGTDAELARRIGAHPPHITEMRKGLRAISPETTAMLCDVLELPGEEAREWLAIAVIENPKNAEKRGLLEKVFFVLSGLGVVGSLATTTPNDAYASGMMWSADNSRSIVSHVTPTEPSYSSVTDTLHIVAC